MVLACTLSVSAQLTFTQSSFSDWVLTVDTARSIAPAPSYPELSPGLNMFWDLSIVTYTDTNFMYPHLPVSNPAFPEAAFQDGLIYYINPVLKYDFHPVGALKPDGFAYFGQRVERQAFSLTSISGGPTDSLVFPAQNIHYSSIEHTIPFPETLGTTWSSNYTFATDFSITVQVFQLQNAPCIRKTHIIEHDSVAGWGKMRVKGKDGTISGDIDVLMVRGISTQIDSFFLYGQPAPPSMLTAFGLTQGQVTQEFETKFYRENELTPLCFARYRDNSYSSAKVKYIRVHINRQNTATGLLDQKNISKTKIFPNPVVAGNPIQIQLPDRITTSLSYTIVNSAGQIVTRGILQAINGQAQISNLGQLSRGLYYVRLWGADGAISSLPLSVQ